MVSDSDPKTEAAIDGDRHPVLDRRWERSQAPVPRNLEVVSRLDALSPLVRLGRQTRHHNSSDELLRLDGAPGIGGAVLEAIAEEQLVDLRHVHDDAVDHPRRVDD